MAVREKRRVVLAEDDADRAREMGGILETVGAYEVWITKRRGAVEGLLEQTNALWVILDLNLEDGNAADIVPDLRRRFKKDILIIVLSGFYEEYKEFDLLAKGVDLYLRKPYEPKALLAQMAVLLARLEGKELQETSGLKLAFGGGILDVDRGVYKKGDDRVKVPRVQMQMIRRLASARDDDGWQFVERGELVVELWADDFAEDPEAAVERVRKLRTRMRETLGMEITETRVDYARHLPSIRLSSEVKVVA